MTFRAGGRNSHNRSLHDSQEAFFKEVIHELQFTFWCSGLVPTGANIPNRLVRTDMPKPNERRNILIPANENTYSGLWESKTVWPSAPNDGSREILYMTGYLLQRARATDMLIQIVTIRIRRFVEKFSPWRRFARLRSFNKEDRAFPLI